MVSKNKTLQGLFESFGNDKKLRSSETGPELENKIIKRLDDSGFKAVTKDELTAQQIKEINKYLDDCCEEPKTFGLADRRYIHQPKGSQNFPDFLIIENGKPWFVEVKKTKSGKPMWNGGIPVAIGIYIFVGTTHGETDITFFLGRDVVSKQEYNMMDEFYQLIENQAEFFNNLLAKVDKNFNRGFIVRPRRAYDQAQKYNPSAHVDFFTHPDRAQCEKNVIDAMKHSVTSEE